MRQARRTPGTVYVNGKFLQHPMTGTERFAAEVTRRIVAAQAHPTVLLLPAGVDPPGWVDPRHCRTLRLRGIAFEQVSLPLTTRGALLLNFGGPAPLLKRRQLVTMHDATPFRGLGTFSRLFVAWYVLLYAVLTRTARHLVTVSRFSAGELADVFRVPAARFTVVGCGTEHLAEHLDEHGEGVRPDTLPEHVRGFVLMLGTLARHKNVVPVARALSGTGVDVVLAGSMGKQGVFGDRPELDPGTLPADVHLIGRVPDSSVGWLYRHAVAFVLPSLYEGFGIPLVEAQTAGCPVIASNAASLPEVGGEGALYFDPARPDEAARLLRRVLGLDERGRREMIAGGRLNAERFSWDDVAHDIMAIAGMAGAGATRVRSVSSAIPED